MTYPYRRHRSAAPNDDSAIPAVRVCYRHTTGTFGKKNAPGLFISGPIPYWWMQAANALPGKAGAVGLALWFLKGLKRSPTFAVTAQAVALAGCGRQALSRALSALSEAGLIAIQPRPGARTVVSIRESQRAKGDVETPQIAAHHSGFGPSERALDLGDGSTRSEG